MLWPQEDVNCPTVLQGYSDDAGCATTMQQRDGIKRTTSLCGPHGDGTSFCNDRSINVANHESDTFVQASLSQQ